MKTLKKIIAVFTVIIMTMVTTISTSAASELDVKESFNLNFLSKDIPTSAQDFARLYFSGLSTDELYDLGFTFEEMSNLRLAPAITAYEYDECDDPYYYFPVLCEDRIIATITLVSLGNDEYSAQFGKCKFAMGLDRLNRDCDKTYILIISEEGMFAVDQDNNFTLVDSYADDTALFRCDLSDCEQPDVTFEYASLTNSVPVIINNQTVYDDSLNLKSSRLTWLASVDVPFVPNGSNSDYPGGYCWASSITSVIKYRLDSSTKSVTTILNEILAKKVQGNDQNVKNILSSYVGSPVTLSVTGAMTQWEIATAVRAGRPIYTNWQREGGAHAMVVRGSFMHDELVGPGYREYGTASIMDPNESTYQSCSLIPEVKYVKGTRTYTWYSSIY